MKVFVTGGSGFLGRALLRRLAADDHLVSALARSDRSARRVEELGARAVRGSLGDLESWKEALDGHDAVVHCAAPVEFWGPWEKFHQPITLASRDLLRASAEAGVPRFVYISSESVLQARDSLLDIDEAHPYPQEPNSFYGKAKMLAEKEILASDLPIHRVILRPTFIWGPGVKALADIEAKIRAGQFMWVDDGRHVIEMVHVDNVAEAIAQALTLGADRGIYFVTDGSAEPSRSFLTDLLATRGVEPPTKSVPGWIARPAASLVEGLWKLLRLKSTPPLNRFEVSFVAMPRRYDISRARSELGYRPVKSREEGLAEMRAS